MPPIKDYANEQKRWYDRAAEMRALAEVMSDFTTKRIMFKLADDYQELGDRAAKRARGRRAWVSPSLRRIRPPSSSFRL